MVGWDTSYVCYVCIKDFGWKVFVKQRIEGAIFTAVLARDIWHGCKTHTEPEKISDLKGVWI